MALGVANQISGVVSASPDPPFQTCPWFQQEETFGSVYLSHMGVIIRLLWLQKYI